MLHATNLRIPIVEVEGGTLTSLAGFDGHQGVAVVVEPRRWATLEDILARAIELGEPPFVLALDSLEDPHNLGTLLRSAEAAGVHGVIFPTHRQAPLTPSAVKASAGAVEHLLLCPVDELAAALADLHIRGLRIAGAEADAPLTVREADLRGPLAIVVGSEGQGLGPAVRRRVDVTMRIPMRGTIDSLNAAVAGSILVFEALAQRDPSGTSRVRPPRQPLAQARTPAAPAEEGDGPGTTEAPDAAEAADTPGIPHVPEAADTPDVARAAADAPPAAEAHRDVPPAHAPPAEAPPAEAPAQAMSAAEAEPLPAPTPRRGRPRKAAAAPAETVGAPASADQPEPAPVRRRSTRVKPAVEEPSADPAAEQEPAPKPRRRTARATAATAETAEADDAALAPGKRRASRAKSTPVDPAPGADLDAEDDLLPGGPPPESGE